MSSPRAPLAGLRVIESSLLSPGAITSHLSDLGATVIKVESPDGDYIREMTWPIVNGVSLLHLHVHRGKQSIALGLPQIERDALLAAFPARAHTRGAAPASSRGLRPSRASDGVPAQWATAHARHVWRCRVHGLVPDRELSRVRAAAVRGRRQQIGQLRAPRARHRGHARGRALPDLPGP